MMMQQIPDQSRNDSQGTFYGIITGARYMATSRRRSIG